MLEVFYTDNPDTLKSNALAWANRFKTACYFDSNGFSDPYSGFDALIAAGTITEISESSDDLPGVMNQFLSRNKGFIPGYFSYDLKNKIEELSSENQDYLHFPDLHFFLPEHTILIRGNEVSIYSDSAKEVWNLINQKSAKKSHLKQNEIHIKNRFSKADYINTVEHIKKHIRRGDIYEINFCQEFYSEHAIINPLAMFAALNKHSPTPFAGYFKLDERYIISATPERFLSRRGTKLISQPIKGTSPRNPNAIQDEVLKTDLLKNEKERAENVMIVDLVRNDLTKSARPGTVKVEELFGLYSFKQVHQMISTVVCEANEKLNNMEIICNTFPMGSMTGAPKISAMQLAEKYERSKRGVYSGALGYFAPNGDFDFNVVIRTLLYNEKTKYLSFHVGSAITHDSDPEKEYEECILKGKAIREVLNSGSTETYS